MTITHNYMNCGTPLAAVVKFSMICKTHNTSILYRL